jgi:hypothetical protein
MDGFTTEPFIEANVLHSSGFLAVVGASNGRLNQNVVVNTDPTREDKGMAVYGKLGYDKQMNDDLRFRLTGSLYSSSSSGTRDYLYAGDRAGGRYYGVLETYDGSSGSDFDPRLNPGFKSQTSFQINPFIKLKGLEFFGVFESTSNNDTLGGSFTQLGAEALYRLGDREQYYIGGRYNSVGGKFSKNAKDMNVSRINVGAGWFMTRNMLAKLEYVTSTYDGDAAKNTKFDGLTWNGVVLEAAISF